VGDAPWGPEVVADLVKDQLESDGLPKLSAMLNREWLIDLSLTYRMPLRVGLLAERDPSAELTEFLETHYVEDAEQSVAAAARGHGVAGGAGAADHAPPVI
jgi:hypothetical protein